MHISDALYQTTVSDVYLYSTYNNNYSIARGATPLGQIQIDVKSTYSDPDKYPCKVTTSNSPAHSQMTHKPITSYEEIKPTAPKYHITLCADNTCTHVQTYKCTDI